MDAPQLTTVIVRMLGKAVKLRHCPATVSAPDSGSSSRRRKSARAFFAQPLEHLPGKATGGRDDRPSSLGRWLRKAQVRRPVLGAQPACVPRGTKEPSCHFACFSACLRAGSSPLFPGYFFPFVTAAHAASIRGVVTDASGAASLAHSGSAATMGRSWRRPFPRPTAVSRF